jgi:hypothetical protein
MQRSIMCFAGSGDPLLCHSWYWAIGSTGGIGLALVLTPDLLYKQPWLYSVRFDFFLPGRNIGFSEIGSLSGYTTGRMS